MDGTAPGGGVDEVVEVDVVGPGRSRAVSAQDGTARPGGAASTPPSPPTTTAMVTGATGRTLPRLLDGRRCWSHLSRWVALGAASVTVAPLTSTMSSGVYSARTMPRRVGLSSSHSRTQRRPPPSTTGRPVPATRGRRRAASRAAPVAAGRGPWRRAASAGPDRRARCVRCSGRPARPAAGATGLAAACSSLATRAASGADVVGGHRPGPSSAGPARPRRARGDRARGAARRASRRAARWPAPARPGRAAGPGRPARRPGATTAGTSSGAISDRNPLRRWRTRASASGPGLVAGVDGVGHRREREAGIVVDHRLEELVERERVAGLTAGAGDQLERRQRVARRARRPGRWRRRWRRRTRRGRRRRRPTARARRATSGASRWNRRCWVRLRMVSLTFCGSVVASTNTTCAGGSSSVFSSAASAALESMWTSSRMYTLWRPGRAQRGLLDEVAHGVDAVVAGGVELVDVVAGAPLDGQAGLALAARLAVDRALAVEHLGQDAGRRGLARAPRPGEEVGLALATAGDGVAQRPHDVVLALQLGEPARSVAAVERRGGHLAEPTEGVSAGPAAPRPPPERATVGPQRP